jgi:hypothetical protein
MRQRVLCSVLSPLASLFVAAITVLAGCSGGTESNSASASDQTTSGGGRVGSHAMVLTGIAGTAFINHVPLFDHPHDVQLVAQGAISPLTASQSPASFTDQLFTFVPDSFSLDDLRNGVLRTLDGQIFVGSGELGGRPLAGKFRFTVSHVVHQHILDAKAAAPPALTYVVFGSKDRTFAVHKIAGAPSFDEVLHVKLTGSDTPSDDALSAGIEVTIDGQPDVADARVGGSVDPFVVKGGGRSFTMTNALSLSCLVSPEFFDPCR